MDSFPTAALTAEDASQAALTTAFALSAIHP